MQKIRPETSSLRTSFLTNAWPTTFAATLCNQRLEYGHEHKKGNKWPWGLVHTSDLAPEPSKSHVVPPSALRSPPMVFQSPSQNKWIIGPPPSSAHTGKSNTVIFAPPMVTTYSPMESSPSEASDVPEPPDALIKILDCHLSDKPKLHLQLKTPAQWHAVTSSPCYAFFQAPALALETTATTLCRPKTRPLPSPQCPTSQQRLLPRFTLLIRELSTPLPSSVGSTASQLLHLQPAAPLPLF